MLIFFGVGAQEKEMVTKTGWNFGALPTITFDTDLGFQYGALVNLYNLWRWKPVPVLQPLPLF